MLIGVKLHFYSLHLSHTIDELFMKKGEERFVLKIANWQMKQIAI